jgi:biotin synthase-like enzyme
MPGSDYQARLRTLQDARELGFKTRTHLLVGIGETIKDIDDSIRMAEQLGVEFLTIAALDPLPFTEAERFDKPNPYYLSKIVAAARIAMPDVDISTYFGGGTDTDLIWGMKSGTNAFAVFLKNHDKTPEEAGCETSRLKSIWHDYKQ